MATKAPLPPQTSRDVARPAHRWRDVSKSPACPGVTGCAADAAPNTRHSSDVSRVGWSEVRTTAARFYLREASFAAAQVSGVSWIHQPAPGCRSRAGFLYIRQPIGCLGHASWQGAAVGHQAANARAGQRLLARTWQLQRQASARDRRERCASDEHKTPNTFFQMRPWSGVSRPLRPCGQHRRR